MGPLIKPKKVKPSKPTKLSSPLKSNIGTKKAKLSSPLKPNIGTKKGKKLKVPKRLISSQTGLKKIVKVKKRKFDPIKANRGVVYIKHIPHGFYEEQMQKYFEQFGHVTRVRLARSERTGRSKGYAFVEFKVPEVAKIAADTMDNYLMFKQVLKTVYIPPNQQKTNYFRADVRFSTNGQGVRTFTSPKVERIKKQVENINRIKTEEEHEKKIEQAKYKLKKQSEKYGVDLSACLYSGGSSDGTDTGKKTAKKVTKKEIKKEIKKETKKGQKKKKISSSDVGKSLLHKLANETFEENDSSDEDFEIDSSEEINTSGEIETSFGENNTTFGEKDTSSDQETNNSRKKITKKVEKKKKISSSNDGKSLLHKLANETFEENDSSDEDYEIESSEEINTSGEIETSFGEKDDSSDEETINSGKKIGRKVTKQVEKKKKISPSDDGKSLLYKLANETFDENDSSDDEFKIDHSFSASDDESSSDTNETSLLDLLASKLNTAHQPIKTKKQSVNKKSGASGITVPSVVVSETEKKKTATKKEKNLKKTVKSSNSKATSTSATNELKPESTTEKVNVGGKRKRDPPSSTLRTNAAVSDVKVNGKNKKSKQIKAKEAEGDGDVVVNSGEGKKRKLNLKSLKAKVNTIIEEEKQIQPKTNGVKKTGIFKKKVQAKGQTKKDQKKMVKETPMELLTAWNKLAKVDKAKKSK